MAARSVTVWHRNTSSVGDMLQHLHWCCIVDRHKDVQLVMMYKIANTKSRYALRKKTDFSHPWNNQDARIPHLSLFFLAKHNIDEQFSSYDIWLESSPISFRRSTENTMINRKSTKGQTTIYSNRNPNKNRGWIQVLRKGKQFLLH
jgi:hypothetical protein